MTVARRLCIAPSYELLKRDKGQELLRLPAFILQVRSLGDVAAQLGANLRKSIGERGG